MYVSTKGSKKNGEGKELDKVSWLLGGEDMDEKNLEYLRKP